MQTSFSHVFIEYFEYAANPKRKLPKPFGSLPAHSGVTVSALGDYDLLGFKFLSLFDNALR